MKGGGRRNEGKVKERFAWGERERSGARERAASWRREGERAGGLVARRSADKLRGEVARVVVLRTFGGALWRGGEW